MCNFLILTDQNNVSFSIVVKIGMKRNKVHLDHLSTLYIYIYIIVGRIHFILFFTVKKK